jgi:hypothetical protein
MVRACATPKPERDPSCWTCRFMGGGGNGEGVLTCRRHAPVMPENPGRTCGWPYVYKTDWCGDHEPDGLSKEKP